LRKGKKRGSRDLVIRLIEETNETVGKKYREDESVSVINCGEERRRQIGRVGIGSLRERMGGIKILTES
jgi:hypothetical protein